MTISNKRTLEQGATALIVVVFSILLLVTISVGFMRMVIQDQIRSTDNELSRGAYDSALAGVEDGKRVLEACKQEGASSAACLAVDAQACSTIVDAGFATSSSNEVKLQTTGGVDGGFDQAYTCVTIDPNTDNYEGSIEADSSRIIPLETTGSFNKITVSWFRSAGISKPVSLTQSGLPPLGSWSSVATITPPIIRAQLIMYKEDGFSLTDFDASGGGNTLYLYPSTAGTVSTSFTLDARPDTVGAAGLVKVSCNTANQFVCSLTLDLPHTVDPAAASNRYVAYLRLTAIYGQADFVVAPVGTQFSGVQPVIDSTGRASNVFRRVGARVEQTNTNDSQLYPRATVDVTKNFCKAFGVTPSAYVPSATCNYNSP